MGRTKPGLCMSGWQRVDPGSAGFQPATGAGKMPALPRGRTRIREQARLTQGADATLEPGGQHVHRPFGVALVP